MSWGDQIGRNGLDGIAEIGDKIDDGAGFFGGLFGGGGRADATGDRAESTDYDRTGGRWWGDDAPDESPGLFGGLFGFGGDTPAEEERPSFFGGLFG